MMLHGIDLGNRTKVCAKCGQAKPLAEFSADRHRKDGLGSCKACHRAKSAAYYAAHPEQARAATRKWQQSHRDYSVDKATEWNRAHPEAYRASRARWQRAHPEKQREWNEAWAQRNTARRAVMGRARARVADALRRGLLVRPTTCNACGASSFIEAAHHDYDRPLDVRWLCRPCHRKWDADDPKTAKVIKIC